MDSARASCDRSCGRRTRRITVTAEIRSNEPDAQPDNNRIERTFSVYRLFRVTNTSDAGSGSLRAAIDAVNGACRDGYPCKIAFRIAEPAGVHRIEPETPLPPLTDGDILIDGFSQSLDVGNTNPAGPEIELRGVRLESSYLSNGLVLGCGDSVNNLAINGFPSNGVLLRSDRDCPADAPLSRIDSCYIGVDASGTAAIPNVRGVYVDGPAVGVNWNVISGNERSGVFVARGDVRVGNNRIGLAAAGTAAIPNGASGVAIIGTKNASSVNANAIAFNAHHGVSIAPGLEHVDVEGNSIHSNSGLGIDIGIDGADSATPLPIPEITSARIVAFEPPFTRLEVTGRATPATFGVDFVFIDVFANQEPDPSGFGEGEFYLGRTSADLNGRWTLPYYALPERYRSITATATRFDIATNTRTTSEFSRNAWIERLTPIGGNVLRNNGIVSLVPNR